MIDDWGAGYDQVVAYETWFWGNFRVVVTDPPLPPDPDNPYSNFTIVSDGPPVAHAVAAGSSRPECGAVEKILPHGFPWPHPIPEHWVRCSACLGLHPL
ncbi:hypothetical protein GCM10027089_52940 [Nocardia thraciensis]